MRIYGGTMLKVVKRTYPLSEEGRANRLQAELEEERSKRLALENTIKQQGGSMAASETAYVASMNYSTGALINVNGKLYRVTANIAHGGRIIPGKNAVETTLSDAISAPK